MATVERKGREIRDIHGVIQGISQKQLPHEFLTIGKTFEEALGKCVLRDDRQRNAVIIYKAQLEMFGMTEEIQDLTDWLNASCAVGGYNRSLAAMTWDRIFVTEGAGVKVSKDQQKVLQEIKRERDRSNAKNRDDITEERRDER